MFTVIAALVLTAASIVGLLLWRSRVDAWQQAAWIVRADNHAGATPVFGDESLLAIDGESPTAWRRGRVRFSTPSQYESLVGYALRAVDGCAPVNCDIVIHCGSGS